MELVGEEKRIQALFSEARLADEQTAPSFAGVWNRAQAKTTRPQRAFNLSFVAATALLVCALVSLAWWVKHSQPRSEAVIATVPQINKGGSLSVPQPGVEPVSEPGFKPAPQSHRVGRSRSLKLVAQRETLLVAANQKAARDAKAIASWQSPTATLLESPSDALLKSMPQLNQSGDELKSFLPTKPK